MLHKWLVFSFYRSLYKRDCCVAVGEKCLMHFRTTWFPQFCLGLLLILPASSLKAAAVQWQTLQPGLQYTRLSAPLAMPEGVLHVFRIDLHHYRLQLATAQAQQVSTDSVRNMVLANNAVIGVNGGFFDPSARPLGLRLDQGEVTSRLKAISWWGVLFVQNNKAYIKNYREYRYNPHMSFAIQSGPRLVINSRIPHLKPGLASRTAIGVTKQGQVILVVTELGLRLATSRLAEIMQHPENAGGLGCVNALNLDGGSSTQLYARLGNFTLEVPGFSAVADAVLVVPR